MPRYAAVLVIALATAACASGDDTAARCAEVKTAADEQADVAQAAKGEVSRAKGDEQRASRDYQQAYAEAGYPGTPDLRAAADQALAALNAAQQALHEAEADAVHQTRLATQIVVGDPTCFSPETVARAREYLAR